MKFDKFLLLLIAVVALAYVFPQFAMDRSGKVINIISNIGISLILFINGLSLSREKIKTGTSNWKVHLLIQTTTFIVFPLIILLGNPFIHNEKQKVLWLGLFYLAVLPSTISFSAIMATISRGNIPAAIFNGSISGIIGIFVTPLWMSLFIHQANLGFDFTEIYLRLALVVIVPLLIGILLYHRYHYYVLKFSKELSIFNKSVILLIIYKSFASSFGNKIFESVQMIDLIFLVAIIVLLFFFLSGIIYALAGFLKFNREDKITAIFCGSQKSLILGILFSDIMFKNYYSVGIILLPLMLFHPFQTFASYIIAERYGRLKKQ